ncbi:MAG: hypothetical protein K1X92_08580 [Bacteroidia bacterium]|nr:hypothetical protein [Bacteroidia bacterium]
MQNSGMYDALTFIEFRNLSSTQLNGKIYVDFSEIPCTNLTYKARMVNYNEEGDYFWYGNTFGSDECQCFDGDFLIKSKGGKKFGRFAIDEKEYVIRDLGENLNVLGKVKENPLGENGGQCGTIDDTEPEEINASSSSACPIRILALYTQNGEDAVPDIEQTIVSQIAMLKITLGNSDISEYQLKVQLAGIEKIDFTETNDIEADLLRIESNSDIIFEFGGSRNIDDLITDYEADIVITYGLDPQWSSKIGLSFQGLNPSYKAFSLINSASCEVTPNITPHEFGHLLGARHETCNTNPNSGDCDDFGAIEHAHVLKFCGGYIQRPTTQFGNVAKHNTWLHLRRLIPYYSNPNVKYRGLETGTSGRNNAAMIRQNACEVASYYYSPNPPFTVSISGGIYGCTCMFKQLTVHPYGSGVGPFTYLWEYSNDGITWTQGGGNQYYMVSVPCTEGEVVLVRVTVTEVGNQTATAYYTVEAANQIPGGNACVSRYQSPSGNSVQTPVLSVAPNPSNGLFNLKFSSTETNDIFLTITDSRGCRISSEHIPYSEDHEYSRSMDLSQYPVGLYITSLIQGEQVYNAKFTIQP